MYTQNALNPAKYWTFDERKLPADIHTRFYLLYQKASG